MLNNDALGLFAQLQDRLIHKRTKLVQSRGMADMLRRIKSSGRLFRKL